jgi:flagellar M-ring protein FliF
MAGFDLAALKDRASDLNAGFTKGQKALMIGATVAVIVGVFAFTRMAGQEDYATLYADMEPSDAAAVTERLDSDGTPYELTDGGTTVKVPRDVLYETRLQLSADGIAAGSQDGWSILDDQGITASEFSQRVGYQRALEGELARTIRSIDGVEAATVHLALPKDTAFALDDTEASASVLVTTMPGVEIDTVQVQAIVNLVASSVDKLDPADVTVADSSGMVLAAPGQRSLDAVGTDVNMRQAAAFEQQVQNELTTMLTSVIGPNNAVVRVTAELDFDEASLTRETYDNPVTDPAGEPLPIQESERTETYTGEAGQTAGILGPEGEATQGGGGAGTEYELDESNRTNAVNREVESIERAPGNIERMSVAVILDEDSTSPEMVDQIEAIISAGADIRADRGDSLAVTRMPFDTSVTDDIADEMEAADAAAADAARNELYRTIALGVIVALVLLVAWWKMRRAAKRRAALRAELAPRQIAQAVPAGLTVGEATGYIDATDSADGALSAARERAELDRLDELVASTPAPSNASMKVATEVADMIDNQPEEVAQLLRSWLGDRRAGAR